jgi:hypothetical protein
MESDSVIENLKYLSSYLDDHRQRVRGLEAEVEQMVCPPLFFHTAIYRPRFWLQRNDTSTKDELQTTKIRLRKLQDEKEALRKEVVELHGLLKVKQEAWDAVSDRRSPACADLTGLLQKVKVEADVGAPATSRPNTVLKDERARNEALQQVRILVDRNDNAHPGTEGEGEH